MKMTGFLLESMQAQRQWRNIFKVLKKRKYLNWNSITAIIAFRSKGEIQTFSHVQMLKGFIISTPTLQKNGKGNSKQMENDEKSLKC